MTFDAKAAQALVWMQEGTTSKITKEQVAAALKPYPKARVTSVTPITEAELAGILEARAEKAEQARKAALLKRKEKELAEQKRDASRIQYEIKLEGAKAEQSKQIRVALLGIEGVKRVRFYSKTGIVLASVKRGDGELNDESVAAALAEIPGLEVTSVGEAK